MGTQAMVQLKTVGDDQGMLVDIVARAVTVPISLLSAARLDSWSTLRRNGACKQRLPCSRQSYLPVARVKKVEAR